MDKLSMATPNLTLENIEKIGDLFPGCIVEAEDELGNKVRKVDFDLLKAELWDQASVEWLDERYRLDWPGKKRSIFKANTPITKTLRPVKEDSVDWDTTQNLYIEGDNFEVLKILQESYLGKVKMIYIDPPYNTGNDFVYNDDFSEDSQTYKERTEQNFEWYKMVRNMETNGRFHSDWLSMMYERLKIARDLLKDDWCIFISIDDHEHDNLRKICDEIFWENNFVCDMVWKSKSWWANDVVAVATDSENILLYSKNIQYFTVNPDRELEVTTSYNQVDEDWRRYALDRLDKQSLWYQASLDFPIKWPDWKTYTVEHKNPDNKVARWRWGADTVKERYNELVFKRPYVYTKNYEKEWSTPRNLLIEERFWRTRTWKTEIADLFDKIVYFSFPKPTKLLRHLIKLATNSWDIVMDFFSWSATTWHATLICNSEDSTDRKFILIQLPENLDDNLKDAIWSEKLVVQNAINLCDKLKRDHRLTEIWKERIRKAAEKIKEETWADIDYWFRVYRVDESCMKDVFYHPSEAKQEDLWFFTSNIKEDRTPEDLLTQVILNFGWTLDLPIEEKQIWNSKVFYVAWNLLLACFDDNILDETIEIIAKEQPINLVFRDSCFKDDSQRINVENKVKRLSPETTIKVI